MTVGTHDFECPRLDAEKVVTSVSEDSETWSTDESKEELTSVQTIAKFILILKGIWNLLLKQL
jgi:hypothetical protein